MSETTKTAVKTKRETRPDRERSGIMLDIETMGTRPGAPIIEIGAVAFDAGRGVHARWSAKIDLDDAMRCGLLRVDGGTVMWWLKRDEAARGAITNPTVPAVGLMRALAELGAFVTCHGFGGTVWAKGASFDHALLREAFAVCGLPCPWAYWDERCLRTLLGEYPEIGDMPMAGVAHAAADDAEHQARQVLAAWERAKVPVDDAYHLAIENGSLWADIIKAADDCGLPFGDEHGRRDEPEQHLGRIVALMAALREDKARLLDALESIMKEPYGCRVCDSGKLRGERTEHEDACGFAKARAAIDAARKAVR